MRVHTILVPYDGSSGADAMLHLACDVTEGRGGRVVVLALTVVHPSIRLADMPVVFDDQGRLALWRADAIGQERGTRFERRLRRTHDSGKAIIHEAVVLGADAIFLALKPPRFSWLPRRLGPVASTVMRGTPCPVFLGTSLRPIQRRETTPTTGSPRTLYLIR